MSFRFFFPVICAPMYFSPFSRSVNFTEKTKLQRLQLCLLKCIFALLRECKIYISLYNQGWCGYLLGFKAVGCEIAGVAYIVKERQVVVACTNIFLNKKKRMSLCVLCHIVV